MKADGTLDEIIKKWTGESQSSSNSAVPDNNYSCWTKKQPLKNQNIASQVILPLHHLSSRMEKTNTQGSIWT